MRLARSRVIPFGLLFAAAALPAHAAGSVEISFVAPSEFVDVGEFGADRDTNESTLAHYLQGLGQQYLATGQVLKIAVLDIDLAGEVKPTRRGTAYVRVDRGGADFPRIKLKYSLSDGGQVLQSGEETVADLDYLRNSADYGIRDPLRFEKRMLADWFRARFVEHKPAG